MIFKEVQDKGRTLTCNAWRWYSKRRCSAAVRRRGRKCDFRIEPGHPIRQRGNQSDSVFIKNLFNPNFRMLSSDIREKEKVAKQYIVFLWEMSDCCDACYFPPSSLNGDRIHNLPRWILQGEKMVVYFFFITIQVWIWIRD